MSKTFGGGRYRVLDKLGSGGMAVVYKAQDTLLNRIVTVKVLREGFASDEDFTRRFRREAQAVASLSHTNIVSVYDVGKDDELEYIVMEYVDGLNLKEYIKIHAPLAVDQAIAIAEQICDALDHAHKHRIIHRDIKPHNILLTHDGRAKVTDFGIARAVSSATITHTGTIVGSVHYFSPEQARGEVTNEQSDLYSLGIILFEMVTGALPFEGESPISIAIKHMTEIPQPPSNFNPEVPRNLERVILRAISKRPDERYADAKELKYDLHRVAKGLNISQIKAESHPTDQEMTQIISQSKLTAISKDQKPKRKLKPLAIVLAIVLVLTLTGVAYAYVNKNLRVAEAPMPDLSNLTVDQAVDKLKVSGLRIDAANVIYEANDKVEEKHIFSQEPAPNTMIKVTRNDIVVHVSQGPEKATMPNLTNGKIDKETAGNLIRQAGFISTPEFVGVKSEQVPLNLIISQDPGPNISWPKGGKITVTYSLGAELKKIKMPNLVGLKQNEVIPLLLKDNLTFTSETKGDNQIYPQGYIIETVPKADAEIMQGSEIKIIISAGPGPSAKTITASDMNTLLKSLPIPNDSKPREVVIKVTDYRGTTEIDRFAYQTSTKYDKPLLYYAPAKIEIFVEGVIAYSKDYK